MAEVPWEAELRESTRDELASHCEGSIRPTNVEERREFVKLAQLGYIRIAFDSRIDKIPWVGFAGRLVADLIRLEARHSSLWARFEEQDAAEVELKRKIARLEASKSHKKASA